MVQKFILWGIFSHRIAMIFQVLSEIVLFIIGYKLSKYNTNDLISDNFFIIVYTQIVFLKMHSYLETNLGYREALLSQQERLLPKNLKTLFENNEKLLRYPHNITVKNYLRFLCIPTVVYEQNFPSTNKFRITYFLGHACFSVGNILIQYQIVTDEVFSFLNSEKTK